MKLSLLLFPSTSLELSILEYTVSSVTALAVLYSTELELSVLLIISNSLVLACFKPFSELFSVEITNSSNNEFEGLKTAVFSSLELSILELSLLLFPSTSLELTLLELSRLFSELTELFYSSISSLVKKQFTSPLFTV